MAIYKCKMCGGDLEIEAGASVAVCEYCGTKQTVPTSDDEEIRSLFNRATALRRRCEFDKAEQIYEKILTKDEAQSEAYWGVLLCRFGIEYVEDPKTDKRIPTCHRTSFEAITSDEYYKLALRNADPVQKKLYEEEAKYIDGVQKDILALSQKEEPYDVFICYKETDENGKRTQDSVVANDIYYQLTQEGYKVFYAAITLEDKLGSAYEPIIFAALRSAKVMLAIGTKPEYFNAVWVKNEWSRYLKMMKEDKAKQLIPCYRDMDAYELPEEFAHLQAQDMGKIGFINDLVRGIKKIVRREEPKTEARSSGSGASSSVKNLLKRAYLDLEDENFESAESQFDKMQDIDPENGEVYLIGLLCHLELSALEEVEDHLQPFPHEADADISKIKRFGTPELKARLEKVLELREKNQKYTSVKPLLDKLDNDETYERVRSDLQELGNYRDSAALLEGLSEQRDYALVCSLEKIRNNNYEAILQKRTFAEDLLTKITDDTSRERETTAWKEKLQEAMLWQESQIREDKLYRLQHELDVRDAEHVRNIQNLSCDITDKKVRIENLNQEFEKTKAGHEEILNKMKRARRGAILHAIGIALFIVAIILVVAVAGGSRDPSQSYAFVILSAIMIFIGFILLIVGMVFMVKNDMKTPSPTTDGTATPSAKAFAYVLLMMFYDIIGIVMIVNTIKYAGGKAIVGIQQEIKTHKSNLETEVHKLKEQISQEEKSLQDAQRSLNQVRVKTNRILSELEDGDTENIDRLLSELNSDEE